MRPLIEMEKIHKIYDAGGVATHALRGVSLSVPRGEFLSIMGPSGSGKSTLMHIIGCLDTPTSGTYSLDGIDVSELTDDELAEIRSSSIGFVFQSFNLLPRASVIRNVMLPLLYRKGAPVDRERLAAAALAAVGLPPEYYDHRSNELSGGQMQRVAIARALVMDPPLILADEPSGNLDSATSALIMQTFQKLKERGRTIVLITHDPEVASWADRTVHIRDGKLLTDEEEATWEAKHLSMRGRT